ncbi:LysM peptidoglycan-binding domain-containing protein [Riemerella anatipestifer]|uniref:LysM peptidoglycan-binding domain-containing protein n=1 Tax=Riemerella anatipestifer TaxID=34085 RepID=A0AAP3ANY6_RIEAN|nr:LysM peptidoglycan-binding domain-containing protein [Riemerella anatipestifer]MBT0573184.1 LysM peptidoglycan-binding domain-containing protein [Riemerella anatipestifer]MCU7568609.1 LysM peptidoglycan-binding domain-containing protein [Riemerella anatipestifer]MCW0490555.1 LysM peptidoglycan-binding domain-containing protein [Riemerella anatipestifer]MCW0524091.1 LysM peptidoglycan-binding domain-containing protein [Riemerella anatipestifer]MDR7694514.1 LysM peptidoglycan-binding domain-c
MKKILIAPIFLMSFFLQAQTHTVAEKETPYSISKKYGLSLKELYELNPEIKDGAIKIGQTLNIGKKSTGQKQKVVAASKEVQLGKIILKPKQTLYSLTRQYHVTEAEVRKLNPNLEMKIGEEVVLPLDKITKYGASELVTTSTPKEVATPAPAQESSSVEKTTKTLSEGEYEVQSRDNYSRITKQFGISKKDLFALNPGLEESGLKVGDIIKVKHPSVTNSTESAKPDFSETKKVTPSQEDYITYTVQAGDTVFGILNKYDLDLDQLLELNPQISDGLKPGMVLKIKKFNKAYVKKNTNALKVVLMLPFGFDTGDSKYRGLATDFLMGAKLAVQMNAKKGQELDFNIIDAGNEKAFKKNLIQIDPSNTDLIIGPLFKSNVLEVLDYVKDTQIPVVAPFANSEDMYDFGNLIIAETDKTIYADRIAKEVKEVFSNQKIYIVSGADTINADYIKTKLEKSLKKADIVIVDNASKIELEQNMMTGQSSPVIAILASDDDAVGNAFASKLINLSKETKGIKAFSMFYTSAFDKKVDELSQASLVYIMDRKIDSEGDFEKEVLAAYKSKYCKTPSKYAVVGFDIVNDMLSRENKKGEIFKQMGQTQTQLATKFEFQRVKPNGAYVNVGYRVVRLLP